MPHKRAKRSVREAERKKRADLEPVESEMPKGIARVLGAEGVRAAYRARRAKEKGKKESEEVRVLAGEGLGAFNRRVEEAHRPLVRAAMKRRRKKRATKEVGTKEVATVPSSAPRRLNEVAMEPPVLRHVER